ncbi:hypothetical protein F4804DRAFT_308291 [Jackrogersella minutella]|nr:hypothetical protein F4804DRAFT_308291 [Jackrogersella minutella]
MDFCRHSPLAYLISFTLRHSVFLSATCLTRTARSVACSAAHTQEWERFQQGRRRASVMRTTVAAKARFQHQRMARLTGSSFGC